MDSGRGQEPGGPGFYAHIPFCAAKCAYCDFSSAPFCEGEPGAGPLAEAYVARLLNWADRLALEEGLSGFDSAFVGGGTPSVLPEPVLAALLEGISRRTGAARERSVEANPESLSAEKLAIIETSGFTRISLGVQSLSDESLRAVRRRASARDALRALDLLAARWRGDLSVDLMAGLPFETPEAMAESVEAALAAGAAHISLYDLTLEEGTPLARAVDSGSVPLPDEDERAEARAAAEARLEAAGLARYEVSNWARPGAECLHNLKYWMQGEWIGAGVAATGQSKLPGGGLRRRSGAPGIRAFLADPAGGERVESVSPREACFEAAMLALRTTRGLDLAAHAERFGPGSARFALDFASSRGLLLASSPDRIAPTPAGLDLLNPLLADFLEALEQAWPDGEAAFPA